MADQRSERNLGHGAALVGGAATFVAEASSLLPLGTSNVVTVVITSIVQEFATRTLSVREKSRIDNVIDIAGKRTSSRLLAGANPRHDGFFDATQLNRASAEELLEAVLLKARESFDERKVHHMGVFFSNLVFADEVSPTTAHVLIRQLDRLTYRQMCYLSLVGAMGVIDAEALRRFSHDVPDIEAFKREEMDLHSMDLGTLGLLTSQGAWDDRLSVLGELLHDLSGLNEIPSSERDSILEILSSLTRAAR